MTSTKNIAQLAQETENHYLAYFMANLSLEVTTFYELIGEETEQRFIKDNKALEDIVTGLVTELSQAERWLKTSPENITEKMATLYEAREELAHQVAVLAGYDDRLKMYRYCLERKEGAEALKTMPSDEAFAGELLSHIFEYEDNVTINERVKGVYGELPVRMSRLKFCEWVEKALLYMEGVPVKDLTNYSTYLKETYYPEGIEGYGNVAKGLFEEMADFKVLEGDILSAETVEELKTKALNLGQALENAVGLYTFTASVLNNMLGVLSVLNDTSLEVNREEADSFIQVMNRLYERRAEAVIIDETLVALFDGISLRFEGMMAACDRCDGAVEAAKGSRLKEITQAGLEDRFDRLAHLYTLRSASYFAPVSFKAQDLTIVDGVKLAEVTKDLIAYMDNASKGESRVAKRARIANLLSVLNVVQDSAQEIHGHILSALRGCRDEREKQGTIRVLQDYMAR